jgi:hypothetical protein
MGRASSRTVVPRPVQIFEYWRSRQSGVYSSQQSYDHIGNKDKIAPDDHPKNLDALSTANPLAEDRDLPE